MFANHPACSPTCTNKFPTGQLSRYPTLSREGSCIGLACQGMHIFDGYKGYAFIPCCKEFPTAISGDEHEALKTY
jgi:hypothetical protein